MPTYTFSGLTAGRTATVYKQGGGAGADSVGSGTVGSDGSLTIDLPDEYGTLRAEDGRSVSYADTSDDATTQQADLAAGGGSAASGLPSPTTGDAGKFAAVNDAETGYELVPAPSGGGGGAATAIFEVYHPGDNNTTVISFDGSGAFNSPPNAPVEMKTVTSLVINAQPAGAFVLRRLSSVNEPGVILHYSEVIVSSLDGTQLIIANPDNGAVAAPVAGDTVAVPLTGSWDNVGTDLTLDSGNVVTSAGGTFLVTVSLHVEITDPS